MRGEISAAITDALGSRAHWARALSSPSAYTAPVGLHGEQRISACGPGTARDRSRTLSWSPHAGARGDRPRGEVGLPRPQVDHIFPRRFAPRGFLRDRDGGGGLEVVEVRGQAE